MTQTLYVGLIGNNVLRDISAFVCQAENGIGDVLSYPANP
jgi:hypothetical protein